MTVTTFGGSTARDITIDVRDLIRGYIRSYPTGITLVKEFIQNADDAGATELTVVLDRRTHPSGPVRDTRMKRLLGPSLLIANDAQFTEEDHLGITTLLRSGKRKDSGKTGRFGIGFNCCYNITDFPSFISGPDIVCIDPCYAAVCKEGGLRTIRVPINQLWNTDSGWLRTFTAMGVSPDCASVPFTVFRLPLRREGFGAPEPITPKTLTFDDFDSMLGELKEIGPELLLFTKHVLKLKVGCIQENAECPRWDLVIDTADPARVVKAREPLIESLRGDPESVLASLTKQPNPPLVRYVHPFNVTKDGSMTKQSWMILGGLFRGPGDRLAEHAKAMLRLNEKAIPLAGCAAQITDASGVETIVPVEGKLYCGLPIKRDTPLAFHVNGYFDTDSSRTDITTPGGLQGDDVKRAQWNSLLLEDAIAPCAAELIRTLVSLRPDTPAEALYRVFPATETSELFRGFVTGFYKYLVETPVIRSIKAGQRVWERIGNTWMVPTTLQEPLIEDGFVVAVPDVPVKVKSGFVKAGGKVNTLDSSVLRQRITCGTDVDCEIESAPKNSLRRREWLKEILKFCYEAEKPELLGGLPLALLADGRLHTFGKTGRQWVFLGTQEQRDLFPNDLHWFMDPKFCEETGLSSNARGPIRKMSVKDVVDGLAEVLGTRTTVQYLDWSPVGTDVPNEAWLAKLFRYFSTLQRGELSDVNTRSVLRNICLIPDQSGHLHRAGQLGTPLLKPPERTKAPLVSALSSLGVPFVTGPDALISAITQFSNTHADFVRSLSATFAALALKTSGLAITKFDPTVHDAVVDFFANAFIAKELTDQACTALAGLPIIPTNAEQLVSASDADVYLPPSFDLKVAFPATLVRRGPRDIRVPLLKKLGVKELTLSTVISRFIASTYPKITEEKQVSLLKWIRDVYYDLARLGEPSAAELRAVRHALSGLDFIKCSDEVHRAARRIYAPTAKVAIEALGEEAAVPCTRTYADFESAWADFFRKCGMALLPRPEDIVARIGGLSKSTSGIDLRKALLKLTKCLGDEIEHYSQSALPTGELLFEALKGIAWLPAFVEDKKDNPAFTRPARDLFHPKEIYSRDLLSLVGNIHPVLADHVDPKLREALGMPRLPVIGDVCKQLDRMIERIQISGVLRWVGDTCHQWLPRAASRAHRGREAKLSGQKTQQALQYCRQPSVGRVPCQ